MLLWCMAMFGTLRGWSAALLVGFLTCAILVRTIDTFVCIADIGQATSASEAKALAHAGDVKDAPSQPHDDGDASCIHGHCHHWVGFVKFSERLALGVNLKSGVIPQGLYNPPPSAPQIELLRPPRA